MPDLLCVKGAIAASLCESSKLWIIAQQPAAFRWLRNMRYYAKARISIFQAFRVTQTGVKELFEIRRVPREERGTHLYRHCVWDYIDESCCFISVSHTHTLQHDDDELGFEILIIEI
jgi:hypothetical protein